MERSSGYKNLYKDPLQPQILQQNHILLFSYIPLFYIFTLWQKAIPRFMLQRYIRLALRPLNLIL